MSEEKQIDYYALFIIASDPEYAKKYDLTKDELDFIQFVERLRGDKPELKRGYIAAPP